METEQTHQQSLNRDNSNSNADFNIKDVKAYTIRPASATDDHDGWIVEIRFHEEKPTHKILGPTPKDVLDKLMKLFPSV